MNKLITALHTSLSPLIECDENIELIIAYSGGVDSQVLLHGLLQLKQKLSFTNTITVCHVNHGLSLNAQAWQNFAKQECAKFLVNLVIKKVNLQPKPQQSLEALARDARYDVFKSLRDKKCLVLTGHHSDDQSETFLLALKRGSGLKGLSAMAVQSTLGQHLLVRPLLSISRQEIEDYAHNQQLCWVEDESNTDNCFDRNFIRQQIIPSLRERWPSINQTINRSASHCLAGQELLDELAEQDLAACKVTVDKVGLDNRENIGLQVGPLTLLSPARVNNLLRFFMAQQGCLMPSTEQIKQVRQQLAADTDKSPEIKVGQHVFRRYKSTLFLTPVYQDISAWQVRLEISYPVLGDIIVNLPDNVGKLTFTAFNGDASRVKTTQRHISTNTSAIDRLAPKCLFTEQLTIADNTLPGIVLPKAAQQVTIRFSHDNPSCLPHFRQRSRSVKKVLQELNIAPWQRKRIPFLYYDNVLVAAIGYFVCQPFIEHDPSQRIKITLLN